MCWFQFNSHRVTEMRSPTARTKRYLEKQGCVVEVVEKWIPIAKHPGGGIRRDLFDVIDILCVRPARLSTNVHVEQRSHGLIAIQSTSGSNHTARVKKALASHKLRLFLMTGNQFEIWSWSKKGARGKRKTWQPRIDTLVIEGGEVKVVRENE